MPNKIHTPVLLNETISLLNIKANGIYVDATAGFGGHASAIYQKLDQGKLVCIDQDINAVNYLNELFKDQKNVCVFHDNFINLTQLLKTVSISSVDGIVADLGLSSLMIDDETRGFSYHTNAKLDMRMNQNQALSAYEVVNNYTKGDLIRIFKEYGEAKYASVVANHIICVRENQPITTTSELVEVIKEALPVRELKKDKHPARIYFQAIRMEVNHELENLKEFINQATSLLNKGGILAIITFHSLEDRIVKKAFASLTTSHLPKELGINEQINYRLVNKHPILPSNKEISSNIRSHSAKLRAIERINYV